MSVFVNKHEEIARVAEIGGTVLVGQTGTWNVGVSGTVDISSIPAISGSVDITSIPAISGTVTVSNTVTITGTVTSTAVLNISQASTFTWSSAAVPASGTSNSFDAREYTNVMAFANSSDPTTITILISPDDITYFNDDEIRFTGLNESGVFDIENTGFYYKMQTLNASTLTAGFMVKT